MSKIFGIDVSFWQGDFDFKKAKNEGVKFAILRGAYSTSKDKKFETYYKQAKAQGLGVGVYLYSMATTTAKAKEEAEKLYTNCLKEKQFELPIYFDIEDKVQKKLSKKQNTAIVKAFCETLETKGYWVGIYASKSFYSDYLNDKDLQGYAHWVAQWSKSCTYKGNDGVLGMWQFGGETNLIRNNKIAGKTCDQNYMLIDYPAKIKMKGLNGFKKASTTIAEKTKNKNSSSSNFLGKRGYLKYGDSGENVGKIASFMYKTFPSYTKKAALGNYFGKNLLASIKEFQRRTGLEADGNIGPLTLKKLVKYGFKY